LVGSKRVCSLWADADRRILNVEWLVWGSRSGAPSCQRQRGLGGRAPGLWWFLQFFQ